MSYKTDIFGYVIVESSKSSDFGTDPEKTAYENFTAFQNAVDSGYRILIIGGDDETIELSQPVYLKSNKTYVLRGILKSMDGLSSVVTSDVDAGDSTFDVTNPERFNVGEWVGITDDLQDDAYNRLRATAGKITDITGNTITIDGLCSYDYLVSENAIVYHANSVIIAEEKENIKITGNGIIDGNKASQGQIHPVVGNVSIIEEQRACCGLVFRTVSNGVIEEITIQDSLVHNYSINSHDLVSGTRNYDIIIENAKGYRAGEKNFLLRDVTRLTINDLIGNDAVWEDGIMCYVDCKDVVINNILASRNGRNGFGWNGESNDNLVAGNLYLEENETNLRIACKNATLANVVSIDGLVTISDQYVCHDIVINNLTIRNTTGVYMLGFRGGVEDVVINNLIIDGCNGVGIHASEWVEEGELPVNVVINGKGIYNHTGTKIEIAEGSEITFNDFEGL